MQCITPQQAVQAYERTITGESVHPGWVYVIEVEDAIKVGWTSDPYQRIAWHQRNTDPFLHIWWLSPGSRDDERRLLERYAPLRLRGREWFLPDSSIREDCDSERIFSFLYQLELDV